MAGDYWQLALKTNHLGLLAYITYHHMIIIGLGTFPYRRRELQSMGPEGRLEDLEKLTSGAHPGKVSMEKPNDDLQHGWMKVSPSRALPLGSLETNLERALKIPVRGL